MDKQKVQRIQELRRSNASQPHVTKELTDQEAINQSIEDSGDFDDNWNPLTGRPMEHEPTLGELGLTSGS